ncbi:MAG: murein biosynthesis integral membrane protein MurJ [Alphaproteobacteria bacterium]|nr:MAG: murein biosynthesis integral membrane protein MurJ [Alphaproteobacteria bacterium]
MSLVRSLATVGGYTGISRILGFVRDILIAAAVGTGPVADAFFVAFRLPNLFRRLFAEGAFNAAFVPLFARRLEQEGRAAARAFAEEALSVLLSALLVMCAVAMAAMPWLMHLLAPGFAADPAKFELAVQLSRITFPYLLFMALVALLGGVLNALYRFAAAAAAPILLNVLFILALTVVLPVTGRPGHVMAWSVAVAGIGQFLLLVAACRRAGMDLHLPRPRLSSAVRRLLGLMVPGILSAGAMQVNLVVGTIIASLQAGAVSYLYYADRVYQLPLGLIGIGLGIVLLPDLARKLRAGAEAEAMHSLNRGLELGLLLTVPAATALLVIAEPIIVVLFERGAFDRTAAAATAWALAAYAFGLPAFVLVKVLQPAFFAREDTVRPLKMATAGVVANIVLSLILFWPLRHVGLALATSLAAWLNAGLLAAALHRRRFLVLDARLRARLPRIVAASVAMGAVLWLAHSALAPWFEAAPVWRIAALAMLVAGGLSAYGVLAVMLGALERADLGLLMRRSGGPARS